VLSHDTETNADIVAMVAASSALTLSGIPFMGPISGCRVGYQDGEYTLNPKMSEVSDLDLVVAGTNSAVLMVESQANQLSEEIMLGAVTFGHKEMQPVIDMIIDLAEECAKEPWKFEYVENTDLKELVKKECSDDIAKAYSLTDKMERHSALTVCKDKLLSAHEANEEISSNELMAYFKKIEKEIVRGQIINKKSRIDGRKLDEIRNISNEVSWLPRTHGSALFTRGETQAIVVATLGFGEDEQRIEALQGSYKEKIYASL